MVEELPERRPKGYLCVGDASFVFDRVSDKFREVYWSYKDDCYKWMTEEIREKRKRFYRVECGTGYTAFSLPPDWEDR